MSKFGGMASEEERVGKSVFEDTNSEKAETTTEAIAKTSKEGISTSEVEKVECECCGLEEECTGAYIEHVKGLYCGRWVCGLCAEAVKEERGKSITTIQEEEEEQHHHHQQEPLEEKEEDMAEALAAHMNFCMQFNNKAHKQKASSIDELLAAMRLLLRRSSSAPSSPRPSPPMHRSHRCLTSFPEAFQ